MELVNKAHEKDEQARMVRRAVMELPVKHQAVVSLYYFEAMPLQNIASILGCRLGTVKSRLARARLALRTKLENYEGQGHDTQD